MKHFVCLTALSLMACSTPFERGQNATDVGSAGADDMPAAGVGGSAGAPIGNSQAGKAGSNVGGTDSGVAGTSEVPSAGSGTAGSGVAGMATAGNGSAGTGTAGMPSAGSGTGGTDSPAAGTGGTSNGGTDSGTGGTTTDPIDCSREPTSFTDPVWNWGDIDPYPQCTNQLKRIGKSVLTGIAPAGCEWQEDSAVVECSFSGTLVCQPVGVSPGFTVFVRDTIVPSASPPSSIGGTLYYKPATAGTCGLIASSNASGSISFSADRY